MRRGAESDASTDSIELGDTQTNRHTHVSELEDKQAD